MQQRNLVLILARDLADKLATAVFVVDAEGTVVYYNEAAGEILGKSYAEMGAMKLEQWARGFSPLDPSGKELEPDELPLVVALKDRRPAHRVFRIQSFDGDIRDIAVTALPLFARKQEFVGAAAIFWEHMESTEQPKGGPSGGGR